MMRIIGVLKDAPTHCAVAQSHVLHLVDCLDEGVVILWIHVIVDQDAHGSIGHLRLNGELQFGRCCTEWAEIRKFTAQHVKPASHGERDKQAACGGCKGDGCRDVRCDESPYDASERHACGENHLVDTEGASLDQLGAETCTARLNVDMVLVQAKPA